MIGLAQAHEDPVVLVLRVPGLDDLERLEHLPDGLVELGLAGVAAEHAVEGVLERRVEHRSPFRGPGARYRGALGVGRAERGQSTRREPGGHGTFGE